MNLIIQGDDKRKAKTWTQFAKNKLRQLKSFMPEPIIINQVFRPVSDILVHIKSINGIDTIRIETEGGKYMCDFPVVDRYPIPHSDFQILCPGRPKAADEFLNIGFISMTNDRNIGADWDIYTWDFGDGNSDTGVFVFHQYEKPGEYTVSLTVSKGVAVSIISGIPLADGISKFGQSWKDAPPPIGASNALAHARMLADNSPGSFNQSRYKVNANMLAATIPKYEYQAIEANIHFDLTSISPLATVELWVQGFTNTFEGLHVPTNGVPYSIPITTGIQSSLGGSMVALPGVAQNFPIDDVTSFIGSTVDVRFTDISGLTIYPDIIPDVTWPDTWGNVYGWLADEPALVVSTPTSLLKTTKVIKVYTGRRGHKRSFQVGDSVHT